MKFQDFHRGLAYAVCFLCASHFSAIAQSVEDLHTTRLDDITITARSLENSTLLVPPNNSQVQRLRNAKVQH